MSHIPYIETIFAIEPTEMRAVFDAVHQVFLKYRFSVDYEYSAIYLAEILSEEEENELEDQTLEPQSRVETRFAIQQLRHHQTGGGMTYSAKEGGYNTIEQPEFYPYDVIVTFGSFNQKEIQYILITLRKQTFDYFQSLFEQVYTDIYKDLKIIGIASREDNDTSRENGDDIARHILNGTLDGIKERLKIECDFLL
jgi:hypothetical protein